MLGWPVGLGPEDRCGQVYLALRRAGADPFRASVLTAIAWAESRCDPEAERRCPPDCIPGQLPEYSVGAFQINLLAHRDRISEECARDLLCSARYALRLPLTAWTTYRSREYLRAPFAQASPIGALEVPPGERMALVRPGADQIDPQLRRQIVLATALVLIAVAVAELVRRR